MRKNSVQTAWTILLIAFLCFCVLSVSVPIGVYQFVMYTMTPLDSHLSAIQGTVLAQGEDDDVLRPVTQGNLLSVSEQTTIATDDTSRAVLTLFDGSTIILYHNTNLIIQTTQKPYFTFSTQQHQILLKILTGRLRATLPSSDTQRLFEIDTPHASIDISQGSYAIGTDDTQTNVTTRWGLAQVTAQAETVTLQASQSSIIQMNQVPSKAIPAEQNLLTNGDFRHDLESTWQIDDYTPTESTTVSVRIVEENGSPALAFNSVGEDGLHTEVSILQIIDKDIQDFQSLRISADVKVNNQSLAGAGNLGSEYPLRLQLAYKDAQGNDRNWYYGFFYEPPPDTFIIYNEPNNGYDQLNQSLWYPYESENLIETLAGIDAPVHLKYVRVYASGWLYDVMVRDLKLLAKN